MPPGLYYGVKGIDYDNRSIHLVDLDTANQTCPRALHSVPIGNLPLSHSPLNLNLTFHYNCSSRPSDASMPISCLTSGSNESFVAFSTGNEGAGGSLVSEHCQARVAVTVMKDRINTGVGGKGLVSGFAGAMNEGFVLDWQTAKSCDEYEASDGLLKSEGRCCAFEHFMLRH